MDLACQHLVASVDVGCKCKSIGGQTQFEMVCTIKLDTNGNWKGACEHFFIYP